MYYYGIPEGSSLAHAGKKGMKWGYNDGRRNGKRIASVEDLYKQLREIPDDIKQKQLEIARERARKNRPHAVPPDKKYFKEWANQNKRALKDMRRGAKEAVDFAKDLHKTAKRERAQIKRRNDMAKFKKELDKKALSTAKKIDKAVDSASDNAKKKVSEIKDKYNDISRDASKASSRGKKNIDHITNKVEKVGKRAVKDFSEYSKKYSKDVTKGINRLKRKTVADIKRYRAKRKVRKFFKPLTVGLKKTAKNFSSKGLRRSWREVKRQLS